MSALEKSGVDLRRLRYFIAVCDHRGFSRASSAAGVAQPALTRQVKLLEKEIGLSLITRTGRGAEPTDAGRFLLTEARRYIGGLDDLVRELRHRSFALSGEIVLGVCPTVAPLLLADLEAYVRDHHPHLNLSVIQAYGSDLLSLLSRGKLDLAVTDRSEAAQASGEVLTEPLVLVTPFAPNGVQAPRHLGDLLGIPLALPSRVHETRRIIDRACEASGLSLVPDVELDSLEALKSLVTGHSSRYSTILPPSSVKREIGERLVSVSTIHAPVLRRHLVLAVPREPMKTEVSAVLAARIRQAFLGIKAELDALI